MDSQRAEELFRQHGASVVRYCAYSTGSWADGEDVAAETFARLLSHERPLSDDHAARWLFTVARNLCVSHHRMQARSQRLQSLLAEQPSQVAPAWVDPSVWRYVRALKEKALQVVFLHAVEGRTFAQTAQALGMSVSAVKMTNYRALAALRRSMEADGITGTAALMGGTDDA